MVERSVLRESQCRERESLGGAADLGRRSRQGGRGRGEKPARGPGLPGRAWQSTPQGCDWLIERWNGLLVYLDRGDDWTEDQRHLALDLLATPSEFRHGRTRARSRPRRGNPRPPPRDRPRRDRALEDRKGVHEVDAFDRLRQLEGDPVVALGRHEADRAVQAAAPAPDGMVSRPVPQKYAVDRAPDRQVPRGQHEDGLPRGPDARSLEKSPRRRGRRAGAGGGRGGGRGTGTGGNPRAAASAARSRGGTRVAHDRRRLLRQPGPRPTPAETIVAGIAAPNSVPASPPTPRACCSTPIPPAPPDGGPKRPARIAAATCRLPASNCEARPAPNAENSASRGRARPRAKRPFLAVFSFRRPWSPPDQ